MPATPTMPPPVTTGAPTVSGGVDPTLLVRAVAPALSATLRALGDVEVAHIMGDLSVEVGRDAKGRVVQRSAPGEPPRWEENILRTHIDSEVDGGGIGELPVLTISASRPPDSTGGSPQAAVDLEYGHGKVAPRPFMRPALARLEDYAAEFMADHLSQSL